MPHKKNNQKGFAALFTTIIILAIFLGIVTSTVFLVLSEYKILKNITDSSQAYYAAEAGIEDALLRLKKTPGQSSTNYIFNIGDGSTTIQISDALGGSRTITSAGNFSNRIRKIRVVYTISTQKISFYYGAQVGDGGMEMGNNARVKGNVFSNGSVIAPSGTGYINDSIIVANSGNKISRLTVGKDATAHTCENSNIGGDLTYVSGGSVTSCTAGGVTRSQPNDIFPEELPISQNQINNWKNEAAAGEILNYNYLLDLGEQASLGPVQVGTPSQPKNLTITNNARLKVTGTIYVTGDVVFDNNAIIELNEDSYGQTSGVIITDGKVTVDNNVILRGSGQAGSYILILSTNASLDPANPAIAIYNNAEGAVFYTSSGLLFLNNNMKAREVTGYKIKINNNAEVQYESGLQNTTFSNGTGGSWQVEGWREIQ